MPLTESYHDWLVESLKDPEEAAGYLSVALEDGDPDVFLLALRNVAEAQGGLSKLSKKCKLNRENLYRMLSKKGNPELLSLDKLLHALGFHLSVQVSKKAA